MHREGIVECMKALQHYEATLEKDRIKFDTTSAENCLDYVLNQIRANNGQIFVALDRGAVIGFCSLWIERDDTQYLISTMGTWAYISDIVVLESYRGQGIAGLLMGRAERHAREKGVSVARMNTLARNEQARVAYQRLGYREYELSLVKELPPID